MENGELVTGRHDLKLSGYRLRLITLISDSDWLPVTTDYQIDAPNY